MIERVVFRALVPVGVNERQSVFTSADGWQIAELEPGRVRLVRDGVQRIVQDEPYVLDMAADPVQFPKASARERVRKVKR